MRRRPRSVRSTGGWRKDRSRCFWAPPAAARPRFCAASSRRSPRRAPRRARSRFWPRPRSVRCRRGGRAGGLRRAEPGEPAGVRHRMARAGVRVGERGPRPGRHAAARGRGRALLRHRAVVPRVRGRPVGRPAADGEPGGRAGPAAAAARARRAHRAAGPGGREELPARALPREPRAGHHRRHGHPRSGGHRPLRHRPRWSWRTARCARLPFPRSSHPSLLPHLRRLA